MQDFIALMVMIAQAATSSHKTDYDCTADLDRAYVGDLRSEMTDVDAHKRLEYVSANHRHFYQVCFDSGANWLVGVDLRANKRIVIVFEIEAAAPKSTILHHSCHVFFDVP